MIRWRKLASPAVLASVGALLIVVGELGGRHSLLIANMYPIGINLVVLAGSLYVWRSFDRW